MPEQGSVEHQPAVNAFTIDRFGDTHPPEIYGSSRQLIIEGETGYSFEGYEGCFRQNIGPNARLQVFNILLEKIVGGEGPLITPSEVNEILGGNESSLAATRRSLLLFKKIELIDDTHKKRMRKTWGPWAETELLVPVDVAVTYKNSQVETDLPKLKPPKKNIPPKNVQDFLKPISVVPEENPKHSASAGCRGKAFEIFYPPRGKSATPAKLICAQCVERPACLEYALANHHRDGIWGGTSGRERREIKRLRALAHIATDTEAQPEL